ncbi:MAG: NUDIX domain-containing protein [Rubrivivax sp.]|nr:NUDIX domain-containing protein [Rubrivivax sp.]
MPHNPRRWSPSVTVAAVIEEGGRFLLVEEHTPEGLRLNQPAGHLEPGETPEQGVVREVLEETARPFEPESLLGVYLSRFVRPAGGEDVTYLRLAYRGRVGAALEGRALDQGVVRTLWLSPGEIRAERARHRSPLVMRCIDDYLSGRAHPLATVAADASLVQPVVLLRDARSGRGDPAGDPAGDHAGDHPDDHPDDHADDHADNHADDHADDHGFDRDDDPAAHQADAEAAGQGGGLGDGPGREDPHAEAGPPALPTAAGDAMPRAAPPAAREPTLAQTAAALAERFPALFAAGAARPVKLRIHADIQQRAPGVFTRRQLAVFLHRHTTSTVYLRALAASAQRFDLDGAPAGEVAAEHREAAAVEVERRHRIALERRAAERAARGGGERNTPHRRRSQARDDRSAGGPGRTGGPGRPVGPARTDRHEPRRQPPGPARTDPSRHRHEPPRPGAAMQELAAPPPDDPAKRERALLLRAWEGSSLTQANFCALKGLDAAQFDAQIELARRERAERQAARPG